MKIDSQRGLAGLVFLLFATSSVSAQTVTKLCVEVYTPFGLNNCNPVTITNPLPITSSGLTIAAVVGAFVDGWNITAGTKGDAAWSGSGSGSEIAILKDIDAQIRAPLPTGTNVVGKVSVDQTTPGTTNLVATTLTAALPTNPTSTLTMTSATTAYTAGQLIATSATAGSVVVPSFAIANSAGAAMIPSVELQVNDATSTSWGGQTVQVDIWSAAPTFANGDRAAWLTATGSASHLGAFTCIMSAVQGDGEYAECAPTVGNFVGPIKLASGTSIFWTLNATTGSGVTGANKVWTLTPRVLN